jgi:hypothetical protein
MMNTLRGLIVLFFTICATAASADTQGVDFVEIKDGDEVTSPFKVKFSVTGMSVAPAGETAVNTGHHHLLINVEGVPIGELVPADEKHIHFGKGQTETEVALPRGKYRLTLQFANGLHQSYGEVMRKSILITVR